MIGPLTNLALALRLEPARSSTASATLTIMGGTVYGRGNTTPAAEFNIYADPEGAAVVFSCRHRDRRGAMGTLRHPQYGGRRRQALFGQSGRGRAERAFSEALPTTPAHQ
jgi:hypothetical protein